MNSHDENIFPRYLFVSLYILKVNGSQKENTFQILHVLQRPAQKLDYHFLLFATFSGKRHFVASNNARQKPQVIGFRQLFQ